jgi:hypothetical protein
VTTAARPATRASAPRGARLGTGMSVVVVVTAFVLSQVPMALAAADARHPEPPIINDPISFFQGEQWAEAWGRFDTWHYLAIANDGPQLHRCGEGSEWPADEWCGSSGWLPLYSWVVKGTVTVTGLRPVAAGVLVSRVCFAAELALLWFAVLGRRRDVRSLLALGLAALSAGVVYQVAVFPISLVVLLTTTMAVLLARQRWALAGLAAGLVSVAHTMGALAVAAGLACVLVAQLVPASGARPGWRETARRAGTFVGPAATCFLVMLGWYEVSVGEWNAPYLVQRHYGHHLQNALGVLVERVGQAISPEPGMQRWPRLQTTLVAGTVLASLGVSLRHWRDLDEAERCIAVGSVLWWLAPLSYGGGLASYYRLEAFLLPVAVLSRRLPAWLQGLLLVAYALTAYEMTKLFFTGGLI